MKIYLLTLLLFKMSQLAAMEISISFPCNAQMTTITFTGTNPVIVDNTLQELTLISLDDLTLIKKEFIKKFGLGVVSNLHSPRCEEFNTFGNNKKFLNYLQNYAYARVTKPHLKTRKQKKLRLNFSHNSDKRIEYWEDVHFHHDAFQTELKMQYLKKTTQLPKLVDYLSSDNVKKDGELANKTIANKDICATIMKLNILDDKDLKNMTKVSKEIARAIYINDRSIIVEMTRLRNEYVEEIQKHLELLKSMNKQDEIIIKRLESISNNVVKLNLEKMDAKRIKDLKFYVVKFTDILKYVRNGLSYETSVAKNGNMITGKNSYVYALSALIKWHP